VNLAIELLVTRSSVLQIHIACKQLQT
jgi:hypothetical protein